MGNNIFFQPRDSADSTHGRRRFVLIAVLLAAVLLLTLPAAANWIMQSRENRLADEGAQLVQSVYELDPASTPEDLIQQGYIDLDALQAGADGNEFLHQVGLVSGRQQAGLAAFTRAQEGLVVYTLRPWTDGWLNVESYCVPQRTVINSAFPARMDRTPASDGGEEVWLRCMVWMEDVPMGPDILLYCREAV